MDNNDALREALEFTDEHVSYINRYGGHCRDCADENGICPNRGLPCAESKKAIQFVLDALAYGVKHGYVKSPVVPALAASKPEPSKPHECFDGCPINQACDYCQGTDGADKPEPVGINGLTEAETAATASVIGLTRKPEPQAQATNEHTEPSKERAELIARKFHDTYERLAPSFGYVTREETRQFDPASPNGKLMVAVCAEVAAALLAADKAGGEVECPACFGSEFRGYKRSIRCATCDGTGFTYPQPQPSALPDDMVKDAARYRWLCNGNTYFPEENCITDGDELDAAIDAAMLKEGTDGSL